MTHSLLTGAGIVAFHPRRETLRPLILALRAQTPQITVFVNGGAEAARDAAHPHGGDVTWLEAPANFGVGEALNILALQAILAGIDRLIVFDQDSSPPLDLLARLGAAMDRLEAAGRNPAAIAPRLAPPPGEPGKAPRYLSRNGVPPLEGLRPVLYAPTSGTLLNLKAWRRVGPFRADFFIDGIDVEWCLRAWSRGYETWIAPGLTMDHRIGAGLTELAPGISIPSQTDARWVSYVRNSIYTIGLAHAPQAWRLAQALYLALQVSLVALRRGDRAAFLAQMARAAGDGLAGRLGPPPGAAQAVPWRPG